MNVALTSRWQTDPKDRFGFLTLFIYKSWGICLITKFRFGLRWKEKFPLRP